MPKGVSIQDEKVMERFRTVVQESLPYSLKINKNIPLFAQLIYKKTHKAVSASTLKRLFLYPDYTIPSLYTLDTICQAIGFAGWNNFINNEEQIVDCEHFEVITMIRNEGYKDFSEFKEIISKFVNTNHKYSVTLALVQAAVSKSDFETLSQLFDIPIILDPIEDNLPFFYFVQDLGLIFRNSDIIKKLTPYYAKHPIAQQAYIERFVDQDYLNGYYGDLLELYHQNKKTLEAQLFYHSLMCFRDIENGEFKSPHYDFLIHFRETEPVHSVPKMRRLALLVIYFHSDAEIVDSLLDELPGLTVGHNRETNTFMGLLFCQIVFFRCDHTVLKRMFEKMNISTNLVSQNIVSLRDLNLLKIYEAYYLYKEGNILEAKAKLNSINRMYQNPIKCIKKHYEIVKAMLDEDTSIKTSPEN